MSQEQGWELIDQPLIRMDAIPVNELPESDWIFFSSPNGVRHFPTQFDLSNRKIGALGPGTAKHLHRLGVTADFIGSGGDTTAIGVTFAQLSGTEKVLFPGAESSLRSIQKCFPPDQVIDLPIYRTMADISTSRPKAEVLVFTSPSNVRSYLDRWGLPPVPCVAIGPATAEALYTTKAITVYQATEPTEGALAKSVENALA